MSRFVDREDIGKDRLYEQYFGDLPKADVYELLDLIEFEYQMSAGLLRPDDKLAKLFDRVKTRNPFKWLEYQVREDDSQIEIINELVKREKGYGTYEEQANIETIDDLMRCWCGKKPGNR